MKAVIDLDSHSAIQDFADSTPAGSYQFKSQDTVNWEIYFVREGIVQDLGAGVALKFGMIKTGDATNTVLAYQTAFTYLTDSNGNVYYSGLVNFNTSQMATAIGTAASMPGTAEIRYQDSLSQIIHSINIPTTVYATILVETGVTPPGVSTGYPDASTIELLVHKNAASGYAGLNASSKVNGSVIPVDTQTVKLDSNGNVSSAAILAYVNANFTTPAANATVSVTLNSTSNLKANSYVRIPIAGYYVVTSITDGTHAVLQNNGDPFNAASGVTITSGSVLLPAQAAAGGGGTAGQNAFTTTTASFTAPAVGSTVSVTMTATSWLAGSGYVVFISSAGYYAVSSVIDSTHAFLTNLGYAATNAAPGTVINSGAQISPGALQGPASTSTGANAYDTTQASFTMPAAAASVNVTITNTGWLAVGQEVYITGAGYFSVASITSPTVFNATNSNYPGAATPGSTIASGKSVSPAGVIGPQGAGGAGVNAFTTLSANFTQPAVNASVTATVGTTAWMVVGQVVYVSGGGYYSVASIGDLTHVSLTNLGYPGSASPGATVTGSGTQGITPGGLSGTTGAGAYTSTTASFVMPAALQSVSLSVVSTAALLQNQNIYIGTAGYFSISSVVDSTHILAINLGSPGNVSSGTTIANGVGITPAGATGPAINTSGGFSTAADAIAVAGAGEVSNIASQTGGVLALKKLKSGPAGSVALTDQGGTTGDILVDVPVDGTTITVSSGKLTAAGAGPFDPRNGYYLYEDFNWYGNSSGNAPPAEWRFDAAPQGGSFSTEDSTTGPLSYTSTSKGQGVVLISSTTNSAGTYFGGTLTRGWQAASPNAIMLGLGPFEMAGRIWITSAAGSAQPTTGYAFTFYFGLWMQGTAGDVNVTTPNYYEVCAMCWQPDQNSGNLRFATAPGPFGTTNTITYNNCTGTITNAFHWWSFKVTTAGNVTVYMDGISIGSFSAIAPLNKPMVPIFNMSRSGSNSTDWKAFIDALYIYQPYTR